MGMKRDPVRMSQAFLMQDGQGVMGARGIEAVDLCGLEAFMETQISQSSLSLRLKALFWSD